MLNINSFRADFVTGELHRTGRKCSLDVILTHPALKSTRAMKLASVNPRSSVQNPIGQQPADVDQKHVPPMSNNDLRPRESIKYTIHGQPQKI